MGSSRVAIWLRPIIVLSVTVLFIPTAAGDAEAGVTCFGRKPTILGTSRADVLKGTKGNDVIAGLGGDDVIEGLGGTDYLCGFAGGDRILGGGGADRISGDAGDDAILGGGGDDYLLGWGGDDSIDGGVGNDIASWWNATTAVIADLSTGTATGEGNDSLRSIEGLEGGSGDDSLSGDGGSNWIAPGPGDDIVDGAGKIDFVNYFYSKTAVQVDLAAGTATGEGTDTLSGIEGVYGSKLADTITGNDGNDWIIPGPGNDIVDGAGGLNDSVNFAWSNSAVNVDLSVGTATGEGTDTLVGIESVIGSSHNDTITGDDKENTLSGGGGNDNISGGAGNDQIFGDAGDDTIDGGDGDDGIWGGDGDDTIDAGNGDDYVSGGPGDDVCLNAEPAEFC